MKNTTKLSLPVGAMTLAFSLSACGSDDKRGGAEDTSETAATVGDTDNSSSSSGTGKIDDIGDGADGGENPDCVDPSGTGSELDFKFSVIWIANSGEGTVSKIDTISATELARYRTGPVKDGNSRYLSPSRTSVNLKGDVVVGNRGLDETADPELEHPSSFTKIIGDRDTCPDRNGDGVVLTSNGPNEVLDFEDDECMDWLYQTTGRSARAVAWDAGEIDNCGNSKEPSVWVGFKNLDGNAEVHLLDEWGSKLGEAFLTQNLDPLYAVYGGAVDSEGNFWANVSDFARVDRETFEVTYHPGGGYGIAMDKHGNPWGTWGGGRGMGLDVATDELSLSMTGAVGGYDRGIVIDQQDSMWIVTNEPCGFVRYDLASGVATDPALTYAGCDTPVGVSVDFEGHVWIVDQYANKAVKIRPNELGQGAEVVAEVTGLVEPYTYSDMTGAMLNLVVNPPVG